MTGDNNDKNNNDKNKNTNTHTDEAKETALSSTDQSPEETSPASSNAEDSKVEDSKVKEGKGEDTKLSETKKEAAAKPASPKKASRLGFLFIFVLLLLLIIGLAVGAYFGWRFWNEHSATQEQRIATLESAKQAQASQIQTLNSLQSAEIKNQESALSGIKRSQEAISQRLDSHTQRIRELAGTSRDDWLLAEARYLLRLATQRILVERGTEGAQALLESADKILVSVEDNELLPVRSAIADEIISLKLAKKVDRQGLYLKIAALKNQIQALPLVPFRKTSELKQTQTDSQTNQASEPETKAPWYLSIWKSITGAFSNIDRFVQIRQHDQAPDLLISEQQQLQTITQLMFILEQTQYALLHEEEAIFRTSLNEGIELWRNYYSHYAEFEVINSELNTLLNANIIQQLPNINRSSELLTDYIESFHILNNSGSNNTPVNVPAAAKPKPAPSAPAKPKAPVATSTTPVTPAPAPAPAPAPQNDTPVEEPSS